MLRNVIVNNLIQPHVFLPCLLAQLRNDNQQNALFKINVLIQSFFVFYVFRTFYFHLQEDYTLHVFLFGNFFMHLCRQASGFKYMHEHILPPGRKFGIRQQSWM